MGGWGSCGGLGGHVVTCGERSCVGRGHVWGWGVTWAGGHVGKGHVGGKVTWEVGGHVGLGESRGGLQGMWGKVTRAGGGVTWGSRGGLRGHGGSRGGLGGHMGKGHVGLRGHMWV